MGFDTYQELIDINVSLNSLNLVTWCLIRIRQPLTISINALSTAVDVLIAVSLCFMLNQSRTGFRRSDHIINKLIVFVVNTGM